MSNLTRREWHRLVLGGLAAGVFPRRADAAASAGRIDSNVKGVQLGSQSYSFRDRPLDGVIDGMVAVGLGEVELWQGHLEPRTESRQLDEQARTAAREDLRKWRLTTPPSTFQQNGGKVPEGG